MPFPGTPLETRVELYLSGAWTDVTSYAYLREGIALTRGRSDEGSGLSPSSCRVVLNNRDGRFSPRNPSGPYYGQLTRNTPIRVSALLGGRRLAAEGAGGRATAPDTAALSITGDLDVRLDARLSHWGGTAYTLFDKRTDPTQRSWAVTVDTAGTLTFWWTTDGVNWLSATSTNSLSQSSGRQAIRATIDVDNGAAGRTITFYTAPTMSGTWTQLGDAVVQAGVTSIFDSTAPVGVGSSTFVGAEVYSAKVLQGIGGTERANPDFTAAAEGATSFVDAAGNTWTRTGTAATVTARRSRFYGEVASWPQAWDVSGVDVRTSVEAAGVLRRLGQGADPLKSALQRWVVRGATGVVGYWPMDDESGSTSIASGLSGGAAMTFAGTPELASNETFASSNPIAVLAGAAFSVEVMPYSTATSTATGTVYVQMLVSTPSAGETVDGVMLRVYTSGTAARWDVVYEQATDVFRLMAYDPSGVLLLTTASAFGPNGKPLNMKLQLVQNGANIDWGLYLDAYVNPTAGLGPHTGTLASRTVGGAWYVEINPTQTLTASAVGQLVVYNAIPDAYQAQQSLRGYIGETAGRRIERLCSEEGIAFSAYGNLDDTVAMGTQRPGETLLDLLDEAERADLGQVFELRERLGLGYRSRASRQQQSTTLALAYGNLTDLLPVEDDQGTRNDVTVTRIGGSSARATLDSGALSTQAPPNGVGRYTDSIELSLFSDAQLADQASYRLALGTIDEARYPDVLVRLETEAFAASTALTQSALDVDHGDLITISGLPSWMPPDEVRQHAIGQSETLSAYEYAISYVCVPVVPTGATALYDAGGRYAADSSTLDAAVTSTATSIDVDGSPLWTTDAADLPLDVMVGGERMRVSAISSGTTTDTFTRVVASGFGTADTGEVWTLSSTSGVSVDGTRGVFNVAAGQTRTARLNERAAADYDAYATFSAAQVQTGVQAEASLDLRRSDSVDTRYRALVAFGTTGNATIFLTRVVSGTQTTLSTLTTVAYSAGTEIRVRLQTIGTTIRAKGWLATNPEPAAWGASVTDSSAAAGVVSVYVFRPSTSTSADARIYVDDLSVVGPQTFTVTRSVNGVIKAHAAGATVQVADPVYYAL